MNLFSRRLSNDDQSQEHEALLDQVLYTVPETGTDISWADAVEGTLITGSTGSGKSSGPGKYIALSMLRTGFGMCILCAKPDEAGRWQKYIKDHVPERAGDLILFNKHSDYKFDFLYYEMTRKGEGAGDTLNMVNALMGLNEQNRIHRSGGETKEERFWDNSLRRLISRSISLLRIAGEKVSISNMRKVVANCLQGQEHEIYEDLKSQVSTKENIDKKVREKYESQLKAWINENYFLQLIEKVSQKKLDDPLDHEEAIMVIGYWIKEFPRMSEKTTSTIVESFNGIIEPFLNRGILRTHFSDGLSEELKPENIVSENKIVIIDFPLKEFGLAGIYAATIYKTTFQAAMERRDITKEEHPKPVGLWIDEYQSFCSPLTDSLFQTTARSSWVATLYITQSIQNLYYVMTGYMAAAKAKSLLGNLNLKYFCSNSDAENNEWASNMIGKHWTYAQTLRVERDRSLSKTKAEQLQFRITPDHFTTLKTGRKHNDFIVEAVVFKAGKLWGKRKDKDNYAVVDFDQKAS